MPNSTDPIVAASVAGLAVISDTAALQLQTMARRMTCRRLRLYGMTLQPADVEDIATDALIKSLETFAKRPPTNASEIRVGVWLSVRGTLCDWIDKQTTAECHLSPFPDDEPVDSLDVPDTQCAEHRLPRYVADLCGSIEELAAAIVLSGTTFDGAQYLEMSNELAAAELGCSVRQVQRYKATLRKRFALFAPGKLSDTLELVTPNR
jgi:DNA-directed RNA polymerase specialized sigma24 family protein